MATHWPSAMRQSHHRCPGTRSMRSLRGVVRGAEGQCEATSSSGILKPVQEGRRSVHLLRFLPREVTGSKLSYPPILHRSEGFYSINGKSCFQNLLNNFD